MSHLRLNAVLRHHLEGEFIDRVLVPVETNFQRLLDERFRVRLAHIVALLVSEEGTRQVLPEARRDVRRGEMCTNHSDTTDVGLHFAGIGVDADAADDKGVPERVHLVSPVVHDSAQVLVQLPRLHLDAFARIQCSRKRFRMSVRRATTESA